MSVCMKISDNFRIDRSPLHIGAVVASSEAIHLAACTVPLGLSALFSKPGTRLTEPTEYLPLEWSQLPGHVLKAFPNFEGSFAHTISRSDVVSARSKRFGRVQGKIRTQNQSIEIRRSLAEQLPARRLLHELGWPI